MPGGARNLVLCVALFSLAACSSSRNSRSSADPPQDFRIVFGHGGGFTGMWQGYLVEPDGSVKTWKGRDAASREESSAGRLTSDGRSKLWKELNEAGFFDQNVDERGNITYFIEVTAGSKTHAIHWSLPNPAALPPLQRLYERCQELVSRTAR
jgi:hypothetical protein